MDRATWEHHLVDAREAAEIFDGITVRDIYRWASRKRLAAWAHRTSSGERGGRGGPLYRLPEVAALVAERHARERARDNAQRAMRH